MTKIINYLALTLINLISLLIETIKSLKNVKSIFEFSVLTVLKPNILIALYVTLRIILPFIGILLIKVWKFIISLYLLKSCEITSHCSYLELIFFSTSFCVPVLEPGIILEKNVLDVAARAVMLTVLDERYELHINKGLSVDRALENSLKEFQLLLTNYIKKSIRYINQESPEALVFPKTCRSHNFARLQTILDVHAVPSDLCHPLNATSGPDFLVMQNDLKTPQQLIRGINHFKVSPVYLKDSTVQDKISIVRQEAETRFINAVLWSDDFILTKPGISGNLHNGMALVKVFTKRL
jgi:hypothetical protein